MALLLDSNLASCCMCFSIRTGCKIIGMLSLFFSAMHFMIYTMLLIQVESNFPKCYEMLEKGRTDHPALLNNCFQQSIWLVRAAILLGCLLYLFGLVASAMLLKGIAKKLPKLFYAWFLFCTVIIVRNLMSYGTFHDVYGGMKNLLFCLVLIYFFCIVKYHERELIGVPNDNGGVNQTGNTALQEVATTFPTQNLPKDNPPPYSVVVDSAPPPYSACIGNMPENQSSNLPPVAVAVGQGSEAAIRENTSTTDHETVDMRNLAVTTEPGFVAPTDDATSNNEPSTTAEETVERSQHTTRDQSQSNDGNERNIRHDQN